MIAAYGKLSALAAGSLTEVFWSCERMARGQKENARAHLIPGAPLLEQAWGAADHLRRLAIVCDLQDALMPQIERYFVEIEKVVEVERLAHLTNDLRLRMFDVLANDFLFHLDPRDVPLYGKPDLFGSLVARKFRESVEDLQSAGNCLALQQSTACVFHLMRVLESAVQQLGRLLGIKLEPKRETWFEICNRASTAVTNRPAKTKPQATKNAALGAAVAHLQTVRLAWRNEVMHPKQSYTRDEAQDVFNATRIFMTDLAKLV